MEGVKRLLKISSYTPFMLTSFIIDSWSLSVFKSFTLLFTQSRHLIYSRKGKEIVILIERLLTAAGSGFSYVSGLQTSSHLIPKG